MGGLGTAYGRLGDAAKQRELLERALVIHEKEYGPNHPEITITLLSLGAAFASLGIPELQRDVLERALEIMERECGPEHHQVGATLFNLAVACRMCGEIEFHWRLCVVRIVFFPSILAKVIRTPFFLDRCLLSGKPPQ